MLDCLWKCIRTHCPRVGVYFWGLLFFLTLTSGQGYCGHCGFSTVLEIRLFALPTFSPLLFWAFWAWYISMWLLEWACLYREMCGIWLGWFGFSWRCGEKWYLIRPALQPRPRVPHVFGLMLIPHCSADPCVVIRGQVSDSFSRMISLCSVFLDAVGITLSNYLSLVSVDFCSSIPLGTQKVTWITKKSFSARWWSLLAWPTLCLCW